MLRTVRIFSIGAVLCAFATVGCSNTSGPNLAADQQIVNNSQDATFLKFAAQSSNSEIAAANVALKQSTNAQVQAYANEMITDHTKANADAAPIAQALGIALPTTPLPAEAQALATYSSQTGTQFDQSYANDQVQGHQATIKQFQQEISSGQNAQAVAYAQAQLPILNTHLTNAQALVASGQ